MPGHIYSGSVVGLGFGYYMPYYGQTYYSTYNPYNYYGQGDICANALACDPRTSGRPISGSNYYVTPAGSAVGTIVGLICFCIIIAVVCAVVAKGSGRDPLDDNYVHVEEQVQVQLPPIEFN